LLASLTRPASHVIALGNILDLTRSHSSLRVENAMLRHQLIILRRSVKRPPIHAADRMILIFLSRLNSLWRNALFTVQPDTLLRWHRDLFRWVWWKKSKPALIPRIPPGAISLLR
jgi:hypothetical protein